MTIDITITMGEDSRTMGLDEARGLYNELGKMFGNRQTNSFAEAQINTTPNMKTEPGNPKVEAAKDRAESRTRGCGSRRN